MCQEYKKPLNSVYESESSVNRRRSPLGRYAELCGELHAVVSSKESADPNKQEGVKILLSRALDGFLVLAQDLSRKKE